MTEKKGMDCRISTRENASSFASRMIITEGQSWDCYIPHNYVVSHELVLDESFSRNEINQLLSSEEVTLTYLSDLSSNIARDEYFCDVRKWNPIIQDNSVNNYDGTSYVICKGILSQQKSEYMNIDKYSLAIKLTGRFHAWENTLSDYKFGNGTYATTILFDVRSVFKVLKERCITGKLVNPTLVARKFCIRFLNSVHICSEELLFRYIYLAANITVLGLQMIDPKEISDLDLGNRKMIRKECKKYQQAIQDAIENMN